METLELTCDERELFVELGHHIARVMWQNLGKSDPTFQTSMWNSAESVYEHGCCIMHDLGVFTQDSPANYRFTIPLDEVRDHLQGQSLKTAYTLEEIIGKFLWALDYQGDISTEKEPFEVPGYLQQAMWGLVKLGYAVREPGGFRWDKKIEPIMISEFFWSREAESYETLDKQRANTLAEEMWNALPTWRRHIMARWISGKSELDLFVYLFRRWNGESYTLFERRKGENISLPQGYQVATRQIAQKLIEIRQSHPF